ncbi:MAG: hypothetical protein LBP76_01570 [Treponema sp.]|jgi:hypothetical protein|nr:hypothetical protein [Treponema sp.]
MDKTIARTHELMEMVRRDKELLHEYQMYELARSDEANIRNGERNIGIRIGTEKAWRKAYQEKLEIARSFKAMGTPLETIALNFKLPLDVVKGL